MPDSPIPPPDTPVPDRVARLERRDSARDAAGRRLVRRAAAVILVIAAIASWGTYRAERAGHRAERASHSAEDAVTAVKAEGIERQVAQCQSANEFRRLFRGYLDTQGKGRTTPDAVLRLPGFDALDGPTQEFVRGLVSLLNAGAASARQVREDYVAKFPLVNCAKLHRALLEGKAPPP